MIISDSSGTPIKGITRGKNGQIIVNNKLEYDKYIREQNMVNEIDTLNSRISKLESILNTIINKENT